MNPGGLLVLPLRGTESGSVQGRRERAIASVSSSSSVASPSDLATRDAEVDATAVSEDDEDEEDEVVSPLWVSSLTLFLFEIDLSRCLSLTELLPCPLSSLLALSEDWTRRLPRANDTTFSFRLALGRLLLLRRDEVEAIG